MNLLDAIKGIFSGNTTQTPEEASEGFKQAQKLFPQGSQSQIMSDRYLSKSGLDYDYPTEELRKNHSVTHGENVNQERLLSALGEEGKLRKKKFPVLAGSDYLDKKYSLKDMKDGEVFGLDDYYDFAASTDNLNPLKNPFLSTDVGTSLGSYQMKSKSNLQFIKSDNKILPYGDVEHSISNVYDFEKGAIPLGTTGNLLEAYGLAKPFSVKANWKTRPFGVIKLENNRIDASGVEWE